MVQYGTVWSNMGKHGQNSLIWFDIVQNSRGLLPSEISHLVYIYQQMALMQEKTYAVWKQSHKTLHNQHHLANVRVKY